MWHVKGGACRGCAPQTVCGVVLTRVPSVHVTLLAEQEGQCHLLGSGVPLHGAPPPLWFT
jgi:hypothetical protein